MRRIGIFGGSFDPIHDGHIAVAEGVLRECHLDEVWLMVSPENPLKKGQLHASEASRLEMAKAALCQLSAELKDRIKVSDFEFGLPRPSYTIDTLLALKEAYPDCEFQWIAGGDNLEIISRWKDYRKILSEFGLIVYPRPDAVIPDPIPAGVVYISSVKEFPYSSTAIREKLRAERSSDSLPIPEGAIEYLHAHPGLYEGI